MTKDPINDLRDYASDLRAETSPPEARTRVAALMSTKPVRTRRRTAAIALAAAMLLVVANLGLAAVADGAVPGDPLYGVDLAYEKVTQTLGLSSNPGLERLDEAGVLANRGRAAEALGLVQAALGEGESASAVAQAQAALAELPANATGNPGLTQVNEEFGAALQFLIAEAQKEVITGGEHGKSVSTAAKALREAIHPVTPPDTPGDPVGPPDGVPPEAPPIIDPPPVTPPVGPPVSPPSP